MDRLHKQLQYFVSSKITTDTLWQGCKVILSGHESPGEGEHKIMDYIRFERSKPDYDSNTRHCLYGLDAGQSQHSISSGEFRWLSAAELIIVNISLLLDLLKRLT